VFALAGVFQFSSMKDRCLDVCRRPAVYLHHHYRRGIGQAFRLGRGHGLFCLGCCWALMLVMFAVGMANLAWRAVLAGLMAYEKAGRHGRRLAPVTGVACSPSPP
jgi:predicted metal-binding membrane protein